MALKKSFVIFDNEGAAKVAAAEKTRESTSKTGFSAYQHTGKDGVKTYTIAGNIDQARSIFSVHFDEQVGPVGRATLAPRAEDVIKQLSPEERAKLLAALQAEASKPAEPVSV